LENLESLVLLEHLSLCDNEITEIQNLNALGNLKVLLLGNNKINKIGTALYKCQELMELNLAGNNISSFREILHLTKLNKLETLCFSDPNYSDNPICKLCNYQTYVIHHLQKLTSFDTLKISTESRKLIAATIIKKRM
jgi:Leucine-rich repeat (LRR) protein